MMPEPSTFQDVIDQDPQAWAQETPEVKQQVAKAFFQKHFESNPDFQAETPEVKSQITSALTKKYGVTFGSEPLQGQVTSKGPGVIQGVGNVLGAVGKGLGNAAQAAINPGTYTGIAGEIGNALQTEIQSNAAQANQAPEDAQTSLNNALPNLANRITGQLPVNGQARPDALDLITGGTRNLINGITGIPADVANAYLGKQAYSNAAEIPASPREEYLRKNYPASLGLGDQLPYAIPIAGEGNLLRTAAEGAGIGALQNGGDGLSGRVANAAAGAALPTALKTAGKVLKGRLQFQEPAQSSALIPFEREAPEALLPPSNISNPSAVQSRIEKQPATNTRLDTVSQAPNGLDGNGRGLQKSNKQTSLQSQEKIYPDTNASPRQNAISEAMQAQSPQNQLQTKIQDTSPQALQNLHASVDDFNAQPTKNYKALASKTRDLAHHLSEDEFESAMGKLSQADLNEVGRLLGC